MSTNQMLFTLIAILAVSIILLLCRLAFLKKNYLPKVGEVYKGKIRVALNDKIYATHNSREPLCSVKDTIRQNFTEPVITLCLSYEATSKSGRFLVYLDNNYCWVEPSRSKSKYKIPISHLTIEEKTQKK